MEVDKGRGGKKRGGRGNRPLKRSTPYRRVLTGERDKILSGVDRGRSRPGFTGIFWLRSEITGGGKKGMGKKGVVREIRTIRIEEAQESRTRYVRKEASAKGVWRRRGGRYGGRIAVESSKRRTGGCPHSRTPGSFSKVKFNALKAPKG